MYVEDVGMDMQILRFVLVLFCAQIDVQKKKNRSLFMKRFIPTLLSASAWYRHVLVQWWQSSCATQVPLVLFQTQCLLDHAGSNVATLCALLQFMSLVHTASHADCSNASVSERVDVARELQLWKDWKKHRVIPFSYLQFPFVLTEDCIMRILSAYWEERREEREGSIHLDVAREGGSVLAALERTLDRCDPGHWVGGLADGSVRFEGEMGVDLGGLAREYISLALREVLEHMFLVNEDGLLCLHDDAAGFDALRLRAAGLVFGLAFVHSVLVRARCADTLWISLLCASPPPPTLAELQTRDREMHRHVQQLLLDETSVLEEDVGVAFPDEPDRLVTQANKHDFVRKVLVQKLRTSIQSSAAAFHDGFKAVCADDIVSLFHWNVLSRIMQVDAAMTVESLETMAEYAHPYDKTHPVIRMFWSVLQSYDAEQTSSFFLFLTGSESPSILSTRITIVHVEDAARLPSASTCFARLYLPAYPTQEEMRAKLAAAVQWSRGFDLV